LLYNNSPKKPCSKAQIMYAIVDIETTGGYANANGITEVAILIHDGKEIVRRYETLVNPGMPIPVYISALTGISNEMVESAPSFGRVAAEIFDLLRDNIFIAHNVNFDYSFLRYHLSRAGYDLDCKKLCTVRLSRKIFQGLPSYSLGKLCRNLNIENHARHRAMGDAAATAMLFSMLLQNDKENHIAASLKQKSKEQSLPPHLSKDQIEQLPSSSGVYYFHDHKGKVIYIGKAKNLKKRVSSHFLNNSPGKQKQDFLKHINKISFQVCATELMAFILEAVEIKRIWPVYNRSLKRFDHAYGLFLFEDQRGYLRLAVDKKRKYSTCLYNFNLITEGYNFLRTLIAEFELCPKLCFIQKNDQLCIGVSAACCNGACSGNESCEKYNERVKKAVNYINEVLPTYAIVDKGRTLEEKSCILMEKGQFYGMGYIKDDIKTNELSLLKNHLTHYPDNDYIKNLMHQYVNHFPERRLEVR
jgi:DNA polymerase III subunit epsilon